MQASEQLKVRRDGTAKVKAPRINSGIFRAVRGCIRLLCDPYKYEGAKPDHPCIFICRHLNFSGAGRCLAWLPFDAHMLSLGIFFDKQACKKHYTDYVLSQKRKCPKPLIKPIACIMSSLIPWFMRISGAIPAYRGDSRSLETLRLCTKALMRSENVLIFPDKDYRGGYDKPTQIYDGFLLTDKLYSRAVGEHVDFIPLTINDRKHCIKAGDPIRFTGCQPFADEKQLICERITAAINKHE